MKINFLYTKRLMLLAVGLFLVLVSCNDDSIEQFELDKRLVGVDGIQFLHNNPLTDQPYTEEELAVLAYDPAVQEEYLVGQVIKLDIEVQAKPLRIEIEEKGAGQVLTTLTEYEQIGDKYVLTWVTDIEVLSIPEGISKVYDFYIFFDDAGVDGFPYPSELVAEFTIVHKQTSGGSLVSLRKAFNDMEELRFQSIISGYDEDEDHGIYAEFNGVQDYVTVLEDQNDLSFTHNDDFSISLWMKSTSTVSDPSMISDKDWGGGGNKGFVLSYLGGGWKVNIGDGSGNRVDANGGTIGDGEWHHLSVTFDRDGDMVLYEDGAQVAAENISSVGDMDSGLPIRIAQDGTGSYGSFFGGTIANVQISDYVLSQSEVSLLANKGSGVQYRTDNTVTVMGLENGATETAFENGMQVNTYDGQDDFSTVLDSNGLLDFRYDNDFSVAAWVKSASTTSDPSIIGDKDWGSGGNKGFVVSYLGDNWKVNIGDGNGNRADASGTTINDGEWHLLAASFDRDGQMTLFQDGQTVATTDMSQVGNMNPEMPIRIAQDGTGSYGSFYEGAVGTTMIFDYLLTEEQAVELFTGN